MLTAIGDAQSAVKCGTWRGRKRIDTARIDGDEARANGDCARFQINRKRKLRHRQRVRALLTALSERRQSPTANTASGHLQTRRDGSPAGPRWR